MRTNLLRRLREFFAPTLFPRKRKKGHKPRLESLETRLTPTATLYVEWGDRFPAGGLTGTFDELVNYTSPNGGVPLNGPGIASGATTFTLRNWSDSHLGDAAADATSRANIMNLLTRYYAPLDVTVVDLTASFRDVGGYRVRGARSLDDISRTMGVNEDETKNNDSYILMGIMTIGPNNINPVDGGLLGVASGIDIAPFGPGSNQTDAVVLSFMKGQGGAFETDTHLALVSAHEAGHAFALDHGLTGPLAGANLQLPLIEPMSYVGVGGDNFVAFSRYPMVRGDDNTDPNALNSFGQNTTYDQMAKDPEIGAAAGTEYITGTGAHNIITVTKTSADRASVTIQAFDNADFTNPITVPKLGDTTYRYDIDLNKSKLLIHSGPRNDRIILDGDLGVDITLYGMGGNDELIINGKNADSAIYDASTYNTNGIDNRSDRRGGFTIQTGVLTTRLNFQEFEAASPVTISNVKTLTFRTADGNDSVVAANLGGEAVISGPGTEYVPLRFRSVTDLVIDTGLGDDTVTIRDNMTSNVSSNLTVRTGAGADTLRLQASGYGTSATAAIVYDAGAGDDALDIVPSTLSLPGGGLIYQGGDGNDVFSTAVSTINLPANATGPALTFQGGDGNDAMTFTADSVALPVGGFLYQGGLGNDTLTIGNVTQQTSAGFAFTFEGEGGSDSVVFATPEVSLPAGGFLFDGGADNDSFVTALTSLTLPDGATGPGFTYRGGAGDDVMNLSAASVTLPAGGILFEGGEGNDRFETALTRLALQPDGATGPGFTYVGGAGDDVLVMSASSITLPAGGVRFDGGADGDRMTVGFNTVTIPDLPNNTKGPIFTFLGAAGNDALELTGTALALPVNGFVFDAGADNDRLEIWAPAPLAAVPDGVLTGGRLFDGGAGDDTLVLKANMLTLPAGTSFDGGADNDGLEIAATVINGSAGAAAFTFNGGGGNDTLTMTGGTLTLDGAGFTFNGGAGNDRLQAAFSRIVIVGTGRAFTFDAGADNDVLDLTATGTLELPAGAFTYTAGAGNDVLMMAFSALTGVGAGALVFNGDTGNDSMVLSATDLTLPANGFTFNGGADNDALTVAFANLAGPVNTIGFTFDGGAGTDSLTATGAAPRDWLFNGASAGTMNARTRFLAIESLTSGAGADTFRFVGAGRFSGTLDGGLGSDILNLAAFASVRFAMTRASANGGFDGTYSGPLAGTILSVNHIQMAATAGDVVRAAVGGAWTLVGTTGTYAAAGQQLTFVGVNNMVGAAGPDTLLVNLAAGNPIPTTGMVFNGGAGRDTVNVVGTAGADAFTVGASFVVVNGRRINVAVTEVVSLDGGGGNDSFFANSLTNTFTTLTLRGGLGSDYFSIGPSVTTLIQVFGDAPSTLEGGDTLILNRGGAAFAGARPARRATAGTFAFVARRAIVFSGIESYDAGSTLFLQD